MPVRLPTEAGKPYRPSNGTEGDMFMAAFCERCTKFYECGAECEIVTAAFTFDTDDAEYPREWIRDPEGWPTCTAFTDKETPEPRCPLTLDMFAPVEEIAEQAA